MAVNDNKFWKAGALGVLLLGTAAPTMVATSTPAYAGAPISFDDPESQAINASCEHGGQIVFLVGEGIDVEGSEGSLRKQHYPIQIVKGGDAGKVGLFVIGKYRGEFNQSNADRGQLSGAAKIHYDDLKSQNVTCKGYSLH